MKIKSDFTDYYDASASGRGQELSRLTTDNLDRREAFVLLNALKQKTPIHGKVSILYESLLSSVSKTDEEFRADENNKHYEVVIYSGPKVHDQSSLIKLPILEALGQMPEAYASQYIPHGGKQPMTYEWYKIGYEQFWIEHKSDDSFRSGVGKVESRLIGGKSHSNQFGVFDLATAFRVPLVRVAYIPYSMTSGKHGLNAIDIDINPVLRGSPVEDELEPGEVCEALAKYMHFECGE